MITAGASVQGTAHLAGGQGCQDAFKVVGAGDLAVLAVADGAGSRDRSALGAQIAVDAACRLLAAGVPDPGDGRPETWAGWIAGRGKLVVEAYLRAVTAVLDAETGPADPPRAADPGPLASTLTAAVVAAPWVAFVSVGDCFATVLTRDGQAHLVLPPPRNGAVFLSSEGAALRVRSFVVWEPELDGVVLATDGCAGLVLDHPSARGAPPEAGPLPVQGFFRGLAASLRGNGGDAEPLRSRLSGPEAARSGDDLTVVCALLDGERPWG